jgi:biopolymer transport protein ExbD
MRFTRNKVAEPEINLIPFIDVLLVVLIFLMLSTTYSKITELELKLPSANSAPLREKINALNISITADGKYFVQGVPVATVDNESLVRRLREASQGIDNPVVVISADAHATHQTVIQALQAAQQSGLQQITFATQIDTSSKSNGASEK